MGRLSGARIIFVLGPLEVGGSEKQALLLARHLQNAEHANVEIWGTAGANGSLSKLCDESEITWRIVPFQWEQGRARNLVSITSFTTALRRGRPDIILPYLASTNLLCNLVWPFTGARACFWNQRDLGLDRVRSKYERTAIRRASRFVANSDHVAEYLKNELGANPARIQVVRNAVNLLPPVLDRTGWRERLGVKPNQLVACMVANLHDNKDHTTLLRAWRIVLETIKQEHRPKLVLAGSFAGKHEALKAQAFDLGLGDSVRFLGQVNDISGLLEVADLGVFSSVSEGSPNGVLECMAAGLSVVATDIPGVREAVDRAGYDFLTPVGDSSAMAKAIVRLANDRQLARSIGEANRTRIREVFNAERLCADTVAMLNEALTTT